MENKFYRISYWAKMASGAWHYREAIVDWETACKWCERWDTVKRQENPTIMNFKIEIV